MKDIINKSDSTPGSTGQLPASEYNDHKGELQTSVEKTGQVLSAAKPTQLSQAMFINGTSAARMQDSGSANTTLLSPVTGLDGLVVPDSYANMNGATFSFNKTVANTSAAVVINIGQSGVELGAKNLQREDGSNVEIGEVQGECVIRWDNAGDQWLLVSSGAKNITVNTIASLRLISGTNGRDVASVLGYYAKGDVGNIPDYYWDATSTATDNGGSIIKATATVTGRWLWTGIRKADVRWFGAIGDSLTDDTAAFEATKTYLESLISGSALPDKRFLEGVVMYISTGKYLLTSPITIIESNFSLIGESVSSSIIYTPSLDFNVFEFDGSALSLYGINIQNVKFYSPLNSTGGAHLVLTKLINGFVNNCNFIGWFDGVIVDSCGKLMFDNVIFSQENRTIATTPRYAFDFKSTFNLNSDIHVANYQITFQTNQDSPQSMSIRGVDGIYFTNGHQHGALLIQPSGTETCASVFFVNVYFDRSSSSNIIFSGTSDEYRNFFFGNCYFRDSGVDGILFSTVEDVTDLLFSNCKIAGQQGFGVKCTSGEIEANFSNCKFLENNRANQASDGDVKIIGTAKFTNCDFETGLVGGALGTSVSLEAGSFDCIIDNCNMKKMTSANKISNLGTNNKLKEIQGYLTYAKGTGIIVADNIIKVVTITHGLAVTPTNEQVFVISRVDLSAVGAFWISNFTATTFDINVKVAPLIGNNTIFSWQADTRL